MKNLVAIVCLVFTSAFAHAYEQDSHLRLTYLLARSVGINDETAKYLAYSNQNVDQTVLTTAMASPSQRALFHFTGDVHNFLNSAHGGISITERVKELFWTKKISIAERNHAVGSMLIYQGLVDGDLQKIGAGLHVKMDTYGHAGFTNAWGHMFDGHNPDRVFLEVEKYQDMVRSVVQSLVAVRDAMPENMLDHEGALKFLNRYAGESSLNRTLVVNDLSDATIISSILTSSAELKKLYAENTFNNFRFKTLALKLIFTDFQARGFILKPVKFDEMFTKDLLHTRGMDTSDTLVSVIMNDLDSEFMKKTEGQNFFDEFKLFGNDHQESDNELREKMKLEQGRYAQRLRDFEYRRLRLKNQKNFQDTISMELEQELLEKEFADLSKGLNLKQAADEINELMSNARKDVQQEIENQEKQIKEKYDALAEPYMAVVHTKNIMTNSGSSGAIKAVYELYLQMSEELSEMKRAMLLETFIETRSMQLAKYKFASDLANKITKDFVPRKYSQYFKQLFESSNYTRFFEVNYKDDAWRRFIYLNFGVNWVNGNAEFVATKLKDIKKGFRKYFKGTRVNKIKQERSRRTLYAQAQSAAEALIPGMVPDRVEAQQIKFTTFSQITFNWKMFQYLGYGQAFIVYVSEKYLQRVYAKAAKFAKNHETEDIKAKIFEGKYKKINPTGNVLNQLNLFSPGNKCVSLFL